MVRLAGVEAAREAAVELGEVAPGRVPGDRVGGGDLAQVDGRGPDEEVRGRERRGEAFALPGREGRDQRVRELLGAVVEVRQACRPASVSVTTRRRRSAGSGRTETRPSSVSRRSSRVR